MAKIHKIAPPASALIQSLRSIGYDLKSAVADIIDNSIAADATSIKISITGNSIDSLRVSILDNGCGMTPNELTQAMTIGSRNPLAEREIDDLGRFGMGLKTASFSQCKKLTVISKKNDAVCGATWDLEHVTKSNEWELFVLEESKCNEYLSSINCNFDTSGTCVIWDDCDQIGGNLRDKDLTTTHLALESKTLYDHLSLVFHKFFENRNGALKLEINGRKVIGKDPFSKSGIYGAPTSILQLEATQQLCGKQIEINGYILPHESKLTEKQLAVINPNGNFFDSQGFYIYRASRLIFWGSWFRLNKKTQSNKLARVEVNIPNSLDDMWRLDIKKAKVELPPELRSSLKEQISKLGVKSTRVFNNRPLKRRPDASSIWDRMVDQQSRSIVYRINKKHELLSAWMDEMDDKQKSHIESVLKVIELSLPTKYILNDLASSYKIQTLPSKDESDELRKFVSHFKQKGYSNEEIKSFFENDDAASDDFIASVLGVID